MKYLSLAFAFLIAAALPGSAQTGRGNNEFLIGTWMIGTDSGQPSREVGVMSINADGRIVIAASDRVSRQQTGASTKKDSGEFERHTVIIAGTYTLPTGSLDAASRLTIRVEELTDPRFIGKTLEVGIKMHSNTRIAINVDGYDQLTINNIWVKLGTK